MEWASTLLHEGIHAEMYRFIEEQEPGVFPDDREEIMKLFLRFKETEWGNDASVQHYRMSQEYIIPIAEALRKIDNNQYPLDYYMYFAWDGVRPYAPTRYRPSNEMMSEWATKANIVRINHTIPCPD